MHLTLTLITKMKCLINLLLIINICSCSGRPNIDVVESIDSSGGRRDKTLELYYAVNSCMDSLTNAYEANSKTINQTFKEDILDTTYTEIYRFTWLRSFHIPIIFAIYNNDGEFNLIVKKILGQDTFHITRKPLTEQQWLDFKTEIEGSYFWNLGPMDGDPFNIGADGASWNLEGRRKVTGKRKREHHFVERHSPKKGSFRNACLKLIMYYGEIPENEIY